MRKQLVAWSSGAERLRQGVTREEAGMIDGSLWSGPGTQRFAVRGQAAWSNLSFR